MRHFVCLLMFIVPSLGQNCDIDDDLCFKAVAFSEKAKAACNKEFTDICKAEPRQLHKRFLARFVDRDDKDTSCKRGGVKDVCQPISAANRKKRDLFHHIEKRQVDDPLDPIFKWTQHAPKGSCCVTTRREVPLRRACGDKCYIVFCPLAGGYQWADEVTCSITKESDTKKYKVKDLTQGNCAGECLPVYRDKTFLVTNVAPQGWFGHCFIWWAPVWFRNEQVPSYCQCKSI